jgi:hypothetical protein
VIATVVILDEDEIARNAADRTVRENRHLTVQRAKTHGRKVIEVQISIVGLTTTVRLAAKRMNWIDSVEFDPDFLEFAFCFRSSLLGPRTIFWLRTIGSFDR